MRTIGRHWNREDARRGDFAAMCDYCGVMWPRKELRRDAAGMLACRDEGQGRDAVTLARESAAAASRPARQPTTDSAGSDSTTNDTVAVHITSSDGFYL